MKKILITLLAASAITSCGKKIKPKTDYTLKIDASQIREKQPTCNNEFKKYDYYKECKLSIEDKMVRIGTPDAKIKIVQLVGGPQKSFNLNKKGVLKKGLGHDVAYLTALRWKANQGVETIFVMQSQFLKPSQFGKNLDGFTVHAAKKEVAETIKTTKEIIDYLKNNNNTVVLAGDSWGAFLVHEYLRVYGTQGPDYILSEMGRLDMESFQKYNKMEGKDGYYQEPGQPIKQISGALSTYINKLKDWDASESEKIALAKNIYKFHSYLYGSINYDYTKELHGVDLSKVIFFTGQHDQHLGTYNKKEIDFIKKSNAALVSYTPERVKELMKQFKKASGRSWGHPAMGNSYKTASHMAFSITKEEFINQVLKPVGWNPEEEDKTIDYYNN